MEQKGNIQILELQKIGFLCSQKCPTEIVLKSYDRAKKQRKQGNCIVCGNPLTNRKRFFEICANIMVGYKSKNGQLENLLNRKEYEEL